MQLSIFENVDKEALHPLTDEQFNRLLATTDTPITFGLTMGQFKILSNLLWTLKEQNDQMMIENREILIDIFLANHWGEIGSLTCPRCKERLVCYDVARYVKDLLCADCGNIRHPGFQFN